MYRTALLIATHSVAVSKRACDERAHAILMADVKEKSHKQAQSKEQNMSESLELYYYPECPYCQKVLWALDQLDAAAAITLRNIHMDDDALRTLVDVGGKRQVPCLFIDGVPLYESDDIVEWLRRRFG